MGVGDVEVGVERAPEQGHDRHKSLKVYLKRTYGSGSVDRADNVLYISCNREFMWGGLGHRAEVVNHTISATLHHGTVLVRADSLTDVSLRHIKYDTRGKFKKHLK